MNTALERWQSELMNSITTYEGLSKVLDLTEEEKRAFRQGLDLPFALTPHLLKLIHKGGPCCALRKQFIPRAYEESDAFSSDFLLEAQNQVSSGIVRRYPYKVILIATEICPAYCRFCTRSRIAGKPQHRSDFSSDLLYLMEHPEIYDVVITGGDPFLLQNESLETLLCELRKIASVKLIRINTRTPVSLPSRITPSLVRLLKKYQVIVNIHFEHPDELCEQTKRACLKMANAGILLGSQTVLLKGINDDEAILKTLFTELLRNKVKPYYLYQCDRVHGCENFYLLPEKGAELINRLAPQLPGLAVPKFVVDVPGQIGKCCMAPYGLVNVEANKYVFKNYFYGKEYIYETK